jgi:hypothetical protein
MKRELLIKLLLAGVITGLCFIASSAQGESNQVFDESIRRTMNGVDETRPYDPRSRPDFRRITELTEAGKAMLKPIEKDYVEYRQFLKTSKTGIAKIFPEAKCNRLILNAADNKCVAAAQMSGQGSFYSFRKKMNIADRWSDIYFADGNLSIVGSSNSLGFISNLGDLPIESLDKNSSEIADLQKYELPGTYSDLAAQRTQFANGVKNGEHFWASKVRVKLNATYGLRTAYWTDRRYGGEDIDLLVVMKVIRENEDGSVTIVWRELQRKSSPKLKDLKEDKKENR